MDWVQATTTDGLAIWINLALVRLMLIETDGTKVYFEQGDLFAIRETPRQLVAARGIEATSHSAVKKMFAEPPCEMETAVMAALARRLDELADA